MVVPCARMIRKQCFAEFADFLSLLVLFIIKRLPVPIVAPSDFGGFRYNGIDNAR